MESIYRGYDYTFDAECIDDGIAENLGARLFSPATTQVIECDSLSSEPEIATFTIPATVTKTMGCGIYNLELYIDDQIIEYMENFARVLQASPADGE